MEIRKYLLPILTFILVSTTLSFVQIKVEPTMLLAERFIPGSGWIEIIIIALYGAFLSYKMQEPAKVVYWRRLSWMVFSVVFFLQLAIGLAGVEECLMTGKLHLPIPMMILSGPIFRGEISFMTILFLSTILLTGPAWCSHFCYFGAIDLSFASGKKVKKSPYKKHSVKFSLLFLVIIITITLRIINIQIIYATIFAMSFGIIGLGIILFFSRKTGAMIHCTLYCPIGTLVNYMKFINPFRLTINSSCNMCMKCQKVCRYDALAEKHLKKGTPGITCTLCGDCIGICNKKSIRYQFLWMNATSARNLYLFLTISIHAIFLALARI